MLKGKLKGVVVPLGTPLTSDERIDEKGMRKLTRYVLDGGVHGVFVLGTMGGFAFLEDKEKTRAIEIVIDEVKGKVPVIAGTSDTSTKKVIKNARIAEKMKADAVAILPPYYGSLKQEQIINFYTKIAKEVNIPLFIYNNPSSTHNPVEPKTVFKLSKLENIVGIKDSSQNFFNYQQLIRHFKDNKDFSILLGTEFLITIGLILGADGVIGGLHNICPKIAVDLYSAVMKKKYERAYELQERLIKLWDIFKYGDIWGGFEVALRFLGICDKVTAEPFRSIEDKKEVEKVESILKRYL